MFVEEDVWLRKLLTLSKVDIFSNDTGDRLMTSLIVSSINARATRVLDDIIFAYYFKKNRTETVLLLDFPVRFFRPCNDIRYEFRYY